MKHIRLRVDELVLPGFTPADAARFRASFERELGSLLGGGEPRPGVRAIDRLELRAAGPLSARDPGGAGRETARAVFEGVLRC